MTERVFRVGSDGAAVKIRQATQEEIRAAGRQFADLAILECPTGRELSIALTKIEEAIMWAVAAIARHG